MPTVRDIAEQLGYSAGTVSRCLSGHPDVKDTTRDRVIACAKQIGYTPQRRGRRSRAATERAEGKQVKNVGLLVGRLCRLDQGQPDYGAIGHLVVEAVSTAASEMGINVSVGFVDAKHEPEKLLRSDCVPPLLRSELDGLMLVYSFPDAFVTQQAFRLPLVSWEQPYIGLDLDVISPNQSSSIMTAMMALADAGHRRVSFLSGNCPTGYRFPVTRRLAGFMCGMAAAGLTYSPDDLIGAIEPVPTEQLTDSVMRRIDAGSTAIVCALDRDAYLVWKQLRERGVCVPQDVSLTGMGGVFPMYGLPQVATLRFPYQTLATAGLKKLISRQRRPQRPYTLTEFDCEFVPGESIAPPRG